jgi:ligand-binding SRPBCC domain-containing protein
MVSGPFKKWQHTRLFVPEGQHASWLEDRVPDAVGLAREDLRRLVRAPAPLDACLAGAIK